MAKLKCRDGDLALVIYDVPECIENVGRIVRVRAPVEYNEAYEKLCWLIRPVVRRAYWVDQGPKGFRKFVVGWKSRVEHPDAWLLPLRWSLPPSRAFGDSELPRNLPVGADLELSLMRLDIEMARRRYLEKVRHFTQRGHLPSDGNG